jgi:uncharacterized membrane protein YfcA
VLIAVVAVAGHALYGNVEWKDGLLLSAPAVAGVVAGTAVQQRVSRRAISGTFAVLLVAVAIELIL